LRALRRGRHDRPGTGDQEQDDEPAVEGEERGGQGGWQDDQARAPGDHPLADPFPVRPEGGWRRTPPGQPGGDRGQLRKGPRRERLARLRVEFVPGEQALRERGLEGVDYLLAFGVGTRAGGRGWPQPPPSGPMGLSPSALPSLDNALKA